MIFKTSLTSASMTSGIGKKLISRSRSGFYSVEKSASIKAVCFLFEKSRAASGSGERPTVLLACFRMVFILDVSFFMVEAENYLANESY